MKNKNDNLLNYNYMKYAFSNDENILDNNLEVLINSLLGIDEDDEKEDEKD